MLRADAVVGLRHPDPVGAPRGGSGDRGGHRGSPADRGPGDRVDRRSAPRRRRSVTRSPTDSCGPERVHRWWPSSAATPRCRRRSPTSCSNRTMSSWPSAPTMAWRRSVRSSVHHPVADRAGRRVVGGGARVHRDRRRRAGAGDPVSIGRAASGSPPSRSTSSPASSSARVAWSRSTSARSSSPSPPRSACSSSCSHSVSSTTRPSSATGCAPDSCPGVTDMVLNAFPASLLGLLLGWTPLAAVLLGGVCWVSSSGIISKVLSDLGRLGFRETPIGAQHARDRGPRDGGLPADRRRPDRRRNGGGPVGERWAGDRRRRRDPRPRHAIRRATSATSSPAARTSRCC